MNFEATRLIEIPPMLIFSPIKNIRYGIIEAFVNLNISRTYPSTRRAREETMQPTRGSVRPSNINRLVHLG